MANKQRRHLLTLTHPQLVALATQKMLLPYRDIYAKTKGQLIELMRDVEGVLAPVKTWEPVDEGTMLDNDQQVIEEPGTVEVS